MPRWIPVQYRMMVCQPRLFWPTSTTSKGWLLQLVERRNNDEMKEMLSTMNQAFEVEVVEMVAKPRGGGWMPWWPVWLGSILRNSAAVPTQQRVGSHQPTCAQAPRESLSDRSEQGPVVVGELRSVSLSIHTASWRRKTMISRPLSSLNDSQACHRREERVRDTKQ